MEHRLQQALEATAHFPEMIADGKRMDVDEEIRHLVHEGHLPIDLWEAGLIHGREGQAP